MHACMLVCLFVCVCVCVQVVVIILHSVIMYACAEKLSVGPKVVQHGVEVAQHGVEGLVCLLLQTNGKNPVGLLVTTVTTSYV